MDVRARYPQRVDILPLGDTTLLVRFAKGLDDEANLRTIRLAKVLVDDLADGIVEVVPSLVSLLVRYDPSVTDPFRLSGEIQLRLGRAGEVVCSEEHLLHVRFGGEDGPDLKDVAHTLGVSPEEFILSQTPARLRVLATGFAPGFVYCGFHEAWLHVPRRKSVRPEVPAGSVLFAAGQTAIAATEVPTGWHVIGRTDFRNFQPSQDPPTLLRPGDSIRFGAID